MKKDASDIQLVALAAPLRHTLQALAVLAADPDAVHDLNPIAERFGLPVAALAKTFQSLARAGVLSSRRGPHGGYRLGRAPREITLAEVIVACGGNDRRHGRCLMEARACSAGGTCALHAAAAEADARMLKTLRALTLADLRARPLAKRDRAA